MVISTGGQRADGTVARGTLPSPSTIIAAYRPALDRVRARRQRCGGLPASSLPSSGRSDDLVWDSGLAVGAVTLIFAAADNQYPLPRWNRARVQFGWTARGAGMKTTAGPPARQAARQPSRSSRVPCQNSRTFSDLVVSAVVRLSAVLADQAVDGSPAPDPGRHIDRLAGLAQWRSLFPRLVRLVFVVMLRVLGQDLPKVAKALAPQRSHIPLSERVGPHRQRRPIQMIGTDVCG